MRILITGALGHIGSRLIRSLAPGTYSEVRLLDDMSAQRYCSLFDLPPRVPFKFVEADVRRDVRRYVDGVDAVVHLAAITDAERSHQIRDRVFEVNLDGTEQLARAALETGARFLFPSTTSVYGSQTAMVDEQCPELRPQSPYAESKLAAERCLALKGAQGLRYVVFRFGTIFGASIGMRFHTAINRFVWQACLGQPLTVWRTARHQQRPYLDIEDAVGAVQFALARDLFDGEIYNVVTLNATVDEIVAEIGRAVGELRVELVDSPIMNQLSYAVSTEKIGRAGFVATGDLSRGIDDTVRLLDAVRLTVGPGAIA